MSASLLPVEQAFYTGDFNAVVNASDNTDERIRALQIRALIAQGQTQQAISRTEGESAPVFKALRAYASKSTSEADEILQSAKTDDPTRHIVALTHATQNDLTTALQILSESGNYLDSSLLKIHILLAQERYAESVRVVDDTRKWANDHIIFNVGEALTSLKTPETAQKAYFIFEENNSVHPSPMSSLGEAVANMELRRFPEASESMARAISEETDSTVVSALSLSLIQGDLNAAADLRSKLQLAKFSDSLLVADLKSKEEAFDRILERFRA